MKPVYIMAFMGLVACGANKSEGDKYPSAAVNQEDMASHADYVTTDGPPGENEKKLTEGNVALPQEVITPKLIRTADMRFQVKDLELSSAAIEKKVTEHGAYVSNANMSSSNAEATNTITIRVPNKDFEVLLKDIAQESIYMERKNVSTQDVTEEYVDIAARLKTKKEVEARYVDILRNKAKTVEEVLKAEEQIRILREEIEAREGRLNYLQNQVSYSTITVQVFQQIEYHENPQELTESFGSKASSGFGQGWTVIQNIVIGIITIWPLILIGLVTWYLVSRQLRRNKKIKA